MFRGKIAAILSAILLAGMHSAAAGQSAGDPMLIPVAGPVTQAKSPDSLSPEEKMERRYPQHIKVRDLIGLPIVDDDDRTLGRVKGVVRTPEGKIQLIVPYGGFLGWGQRLVAIPIEVVAIAGRQLAALDMTRAQFGAAPVWSEAHSEPIPPDDSIRIGLYRR